MESKNYCNQDTRESEQKDKNVVKMESQIVYMESMELWAIITKMFESLTVGMN